MTLRPITAGQQAQEVVLGLAPNQHVFACRLIETALIRQESDAYLAALSRRQADFVTCLIARRNEKLTYDLRFISQPAAAPSRRHDLTIALLCRADEVSGDEARGLAVDFLNLVRSAFQEYEFELAGVEEIKALLAPFEAREAVRIRRRASMESLDTLRSGRERMVLGYSQPEEPETRVDARPVASVFHVFPFLATRQDYTGLFTLLMLHPEPIAISIRLRPTTLTTEEELFIEEAIAACERYSQISLGLATEDAEILMPTLHEQARMYQHYQTKMLFGLRDNAALMTVDVASPGRIPRMIPDKFGGLLTSSAGGSLGGSILQYLAGGYELLDLPEARIAFENLDCTLTDEPEAPRQAKRLPYLFDSIESSLAFCLPPACDSLPGIAHRKWTDLEAPRDLPAEGVLIGNASWMGNDEQIRIAADDRLRHCYIVGQTGTGKTTLLKSMILHDIDAGNGVCVVDPHGDLYRELCGSIPENRIEDVILFDPKDQEWPVGFNMLEYRSDSERYFIVQEMAEIIGRLTQDEFGASAGEYTGPIFFQHLRMNMLLAMSNSEDPGTLLDFYRIFNEEGYYKRWLPLRVEDPELDRWARKVLPSTDYMRQGSEGCSLGSYIASKFHGFVFDPLLRHIFGQKRSTIDLRQIMDTGKILLVNLAKGELTEANSRFLGMVLMAKLQSAATSRVDCPEAGRRPFCVYVDEFQSIATQSFILLLSEARKFGLSLVLANQFVSQIKNPRLIESIFGNVGTLVSFRLGLQDAEAIERQMYPTVSRTDLLNLPNWHAYARILVNGQIAPPFTLRTQLHDVSPSADRLAAVREASRRKYARPRAEVLAEFTRAMDKDNESEIDKWRRSDTDDSSR
jgi:hypothetical protein